MFEKLRIAYHLFMARVAEGGFEFFSAEYHLNKVLDIANRRGPQLGEIGYLRDARERVRFGLRHGCGK